MPLFHLASRIVGTPLLIARAKLDVILAVLGSRIGLPEIDTALPPIPAKSTTPEIPGIAVIPIHGTLVRRTLGLEAASGLTSYGQIAAQLDAAVADPQVAGILLDIDSPGGEAGGVFELAERVRAASQQKLIWAHANDAAFSAAYAIACAAERLTLSQTAGVGSIGVIALHVDQSVKDAKDGLAYTALYAGHHKNDFTPHEPLSPQAATALQNEVDRLYGIFVAQVTRMRGLDEAQVRATEADLFFGEQAVTAGLADAVTGFDAVLGEFAEALRAKGALAHRPTTPPRGGRPSSSRRLHKEHTMHEHDPNLDPEPIHADAGQPPTAGEAPANSQDAPPQEHVSAHEDALAIAELCLLAGTPERTAEFLAQGLNAQQVRRTLLDARAAQPEIASRITPEASTTSRPEASPVIAAVKKLTNPNHFSGE